ncbi:ras-like protein rasD [Clytia hemisphaerica]|uniref:ras-like protein rasD n=1 Tax=Clytia hemisphaerica TaxID=252671 RepID=UPI0034D7B4E1
MQANSRMRSRNKSRRNALRTLRRRDTVGLLILGKCESGKSSLVHRWLRGHFVDQYRPTVEDFHVKSYKHMGQCVNVGVIDMTGSWDFPAMIDLYLTRIDSVMFAYEIGSEDAVKNLRLLHERLVKVRGERNEVSLTVVGTKVDRQQDHYDDYRNDELNQFLRSINVPDERHVLTSSKLNLNVNEAFESALNEVIENMIPNEDAIKRLGKLMKDNKKTSSWVQKLCCGVSFR